MLESYWPKASSVNACIKNEAETADVSVLLAVHQPAPLVQRSASSGNITPSTEQDLLDAFLTENVPTGALLLPITGLSGAGKSHIVRWLDAQLQRSAKNQQLHIIRIPKSASLRTVVELILDPLKHDTRYDKARDDLTRAVGEVNLQEAVITFRAHLQNALSTQRARMVAELREYPDRSYLKALIGHAEKLPQMFADGALEKYFVENILSRVVSRALKGRSEYQDDDGALPQFVASDLKLPDTVPINQASRPVHDYYLRNIADLEIDRLQPVVDLLNDAVDPAIGNVFKLEQNAGGMTLQDVILAVREVLLSDGKDLVLLVEDFAALAGIQEVLLKVCIQEGERDGKKIRATMRTAIALTDGYLSFRDTILTRAQQEWVIGSQFQSDDELKSGMVEMIGAYLNAARWGDEELQRLFHQRSTEQSLTDWLPSWQDEDLTEEESESLSAFGYTKKGHSLFPFNENVIERLADRHLKIGGEFVFNPRQVINFILRATLLMRPAFEANAFPPAGYEAQSPNVNLANWIRQTHQPEAITRRLGPLLTAWGGNPIDREEIAQMPQAIFKAFGLPTPEELDNIRPVLPQPDQPEAKPPGAKGETDGPDSPKSPYVKPAEDPKIVDFRARLDAWSAGAALGQKDARDIRNVLSEMLKDAVDWPSLRMVSRNLSPSWINIPNARGNPKSGFCLNVCEDASDEYGDVRAGLIAAFRFVNLNGKRWTYPEADDDYVASASLVDHLVAQLKPKIVEDVKTEISSLGRALITQSRIAGLSPHVNPAGVDAVLAGLFAVPEPMEPQNFDENWDKLRMSTLGLIGTRHARDVLQAELYTRFASLQGDSGKTPFAIDIVRLLDAIRDDAPVAGIGVGLSDEVRTYIRSLADTRIIPQLSGIVSKLSNFNAQISEFVDPSFDKTEFVNDLQSIVLLLVKTGTTPTAGPNLAEYEQHLAEFQKSAFVDLVTKATTIIETDNKQLPKKLNVLGATDLGLIARTTEFLQKTVQLVDAAETNVTREENDRGQSEPVEVSQKLVQILSLIGGKSPANTEEQA